MDTPNSKQNTPYRIDLTWESDRPRPLVNVGLEGERPSSPTPFQGLQTFQEITNSLMALVQPRAAARPAAAPPPPPPPPPPPVARRPVAAPPPASPAAASVHPRVTVERKPKRKPLEITFIWLDEAFPSLAPEPERPRAVPQARETEEVRPRPAPTETKPAPEKTTGTAATNADKRAPAGKTEEKEKRKANKAAQERNKDEKPFVEPPPSAPPVMTSDAETPTIRAVLTAVANETTPVLASETNDVPPEAPPVEQPRETKNERNDATDAEEFPFPSLMAIRPKTALPGDYWEHVPVEGLTPGISNLFGDIIDSAIKTGRKIKL